MGLHNSTIILKSSVHVHDERVTKMISFEYKAESGKKANKKKTLLIAGTIDSQIKIIDVAANHEVIQTIDNGLLAIRNMIMYTHIDNASLMRTYYLLVLSINGDVQVYALVIKAGGELSFAAKGCLSNLEEPVSQFATYGDSKPTAKGITKKNIVDDYLVLALFSGDVLLYNMNDYHIKNRDMVDNLQIKINTTSSKRSASSDFISQMKFTRMKKANSKDKSAGALKLVCRLICTTFGGIAHVLELSFTTTAPISNSNEEEGPAVLQMLESIKDTIKTTDHSSITSEDPQVSIPPLNISTSSHAVPNHGPVSIIIWGQIVQRANIFPDNIAIRAMAVNPLESNVICMGGDNGQIKLIDSAPAPNSTNGSQNKDISELTSLSNYNRGSGANMGKRNDTVITETALVCFRTLSGNSGMIYDLVYCSQNSAGNAYYIATCDEEKNIRVYDQINGSLFHKLDLPHVAHSLCYIPSINCLFAGDDNGFISIINF